jgi:hypothetical protein
MCSGEAYAIVRITAKEMTAYGKGSGCTCEKAPPETQRGFS